MIVAGRWGDNVFGCYKMVVAIKMAKFSFFRHKESYFLVPHKEWGHMYLHLSEQKHTKAFVCLIIFHVTQLIT